MIDPRHPDISKQIDWLIPGTLTRDPPAASAVSPHAVEPSRSADARRGASRATPTRSASAAPLFRTDVDDGQRAA
jgi:hypothetical protein